MPVCMGYAYSLQYTSMISSSSLYSASQRAGPVSGQTFVSPSVVLLQQSDSLGLVVISEEDTHRTLLIHRIVFEDIYYRQGGELPM